jgi:aspartyl-tRNA synthetase
VDEEDVFAVIEPLYARVVRELQGVDVPTPFPRLTHEEMLARFGSDKPDLRYGMELADLGGVFAGTGFRAFASVLEDGGLIKGLAAPGGAGLSRKELDDLVQAAKSRGAAGLVWIAVEADGVRSPVEKHLSADEIDGVREATGAGPGDLIAIVGDKPDRTNVALDGVRRYLAERLGRSRQAVGVLLARQAAVRARQGASGSGAPPPCPGRPGRPGSAHGPLARRPRPNGYEIGGGIRSTARTQHRSSKFAVRRGDRGSRPPAAAFGSCPSRRHRDDDRLVMLMAGRDTIRDVTAFPKAQSGQDPLTGSPAPATPEQLAELGLAVTVAPAEDGEEEDG